MPSLKDYIAREVYGGSSTLPSKLKARYLNESTNALLLLRCSQMSRNPLRRFYCLRTLRRRYGIYCGRGAKIGMGLELPHPQGIVIGEAVVMGEGCRILQQVTLGSARKGDYKQGLQPHLGDRCLISAGAKVIGDVVLGDDVAVGANAVLLKDAPTGSTCVGVPARVVERRSPSSPLID